MKIEMMDGIDGRHMSPEEAARMVVVRAETKRTTKAIPTTGSIDFKVVSVAPVAIVRRESYPHAVRSEKDWYESRS